VSLFHDPSAGGGRRPSDVGDVIVLFTREASRRVFGFVVGYLGYRMVRTVDDYTVEVLVTLGIVLAVCSRRSDRHL